METTDMVDAHSGIPEAALLQVHEVDAYYGPVKALRGVSLHVQPKEIVAVIGANGAGKTTLLRVISGVASIKKGQITFRGQCLSGMKPEAIVNRGIIHVPERRELFASMSVLENLELGAFHRRGRQHKAEIQLDLEKVCEIFPILRARLRQTAGTLSGGEQQMLAIARGLMAKPDLLLLDEPSLGLAPLLVQEVLRIAAQLRELGCTILLVEQNANGALQVADRAYVMEVGRVVLHGQAHELSRVDRIRRAYLGQRSALARRVRQSKIVPDLRKGEKRVRDVAVGISSKEGGQKNHGIRI